MNITFIIISSLYFYNALRKETCVIFYTTTPGRTQNSRTFRHLADSRPGNHICLLWAPYAWCSLLHEACTVRSSVVCGSKKQLMQLLFGCLHSHTSCPSQPRVQSRIVHDLLTMWALHPETLEQHWRLLLMSVARFFWKQIWFYCGCMELENKQSL